jgi:hypothetical protein
LERKQRTEIREEVRAALEEAGLAGRIDYYGATESLLYNYGKIEEMLRRYEEYTEREKPGRSADIIYNLGGGDAEERERIIHSAYVAAYAETAQKFAGVKMAVESLGKGLEFVIIQKYYLQGKTWEVIAEELKGERIYKDAKSLRAMRKRTVQTLAILIFGKRGAYRDKEAKRGEGD